MHLSGQLGPADNARSRWGSGWIGQYLFRRRPPSQAAVPWRSRRHGLRHVQGGAGADSPTGLASEVQADGIAGERGFHGPGGDAGRSRSHGLITDANRDRVQPINYIAEAVFRLASGDPQALTGQIAYAEPFLKGIAVEPAELIAGF